MVKHAEGECEDRGVHGAGGFVGSGWHGESDCLMVRSLLEGRARIRLTGLGFAISTVRYVGGVSLLFCGSCGLPLRMKFSKTQ